MNQDIINLKSRIKIIDYTDQFKEYIKILNYAWLEKFFKIEKMDQVSLSNPKEEIIDKGGFIYYATLDNEIVGTASLLKKSDTIFELGKMAVSDKAQGFGIGTLLLKHCLTTAKEMKIEKLILYSNTKLGSAIHLYRKYGFEEIPLEQGLYERADIKMEKKLGI
ncbi:GNAT family N-acetyltransferase [Flavobacterium hydatis]|uniref:N-acetyltransferase n=1 Tax=Flavobacterium hydatis TaxID=991 RepID=A0ABX4CET3_FLAHY|nr:GNAT family N-acetyltransferase [Flavobacterium hydatis]OXA92039.1 N-acetyltransferase [Flavobacterium hydatis]